jgi:prevent-host-death family protein
VKRIVNMHDAKTKLSQLVAAVEAGEGVVIARGGVPVVDLVKHVASIHDREPGSFRQYPGWESWVYDPAVFRPMTDEEVEAEGWP